MHIERFITHCQKHRRSAEKCSEIFFKTSVSEPYFSKDYFFYVVFFHEHSRFTGQQGKEDASSLTPLSYFPPFHRHLDISRAISFESSSLQVAGSRTRTKNLWFLSTTL